MGIYIPNIEMPSCCALCDLCFGFGCAVSEHDKGYKTRAFKYDENNKCEVDVFRERASWCPLIEMDEEVFRQLKGCAFIIKALYKKLKEKYKCAEEDEEGIEEDFDPYQGDRDRDTFGEIY